MHPAPIVVFDIDGVLADVRHRLHHLQVRPKNWAAFFAEMGADGLLAEGAALLTSAERESDIRYLTGRPEFYRGVTLDWLARHHLPASPLTMRPTSDRRPARVWKAATLSSWRRAGLQIDRVVDDDPQVVSALRALGFEVVYADWLGDAGQPPDPAATGQQALWAAQEEDGRS